jgi:predicted transcriptional regulator/N-acetylglutamate synthase-like GNAT family acetyltransferase
MYPAIGTWLERKVAPQLDTNHRKAFLLSSGEQPIASVVLKRGDSSKLCHVRIDPRYQDQNLGTLLFCLLAQEIHSVAKEVHFTLPESLWVEKNEFFKEFGFSESIIAHQQYRLFDRELSCSARFEHFFQHAANQLPVLKRFLGNSGYVDVPRLVMSVKPRFARAVFSGDKRVEIRRSFSSRWVDERVCIYSSAPDRCLLGEATILNVLNANPEQIWCLYGPEICCDRAEFDAYANGASELVAIQLSQVVKYDRPVPLSDIRALTGSHFSPPQSYRTISAEDKFHSVLAVANQLCTGPLGLPVAR